MEAGELDLKLALAGAGALGEDFEDEGGAVEDLAAKGFLEVARLRPGELVVEDDGIHGELAALGGELRRLARADEGGGVRGVQFLGSRAHDSGACRGGKLAELVHGVADVPCRPGLQLDAHKEHVLGATLCGFNQCLQCVGGRVSCRAATFKAAAWPLIRAQGAFECPVLASRCADGSSKGQVLVASWRKKAPSRLMHGFRVA